MRNRSRVLALIAPLALLTAVVSPAQAASPSAGPGPITSGLAGKCADDLGNSTSNGAVVDLYDCNAGPAQQWTVPGDGTVRINGKCLDVTGAATADGTLVELWDCNGGTNQSWTLYGTAALAVGAVDVAVQNSDGSAVPGTHHTATFAGSAGASIAAGADLASDPVPMSVNADQDLLVSVYLPNTTGASTWHQSANDTTYVSGPGNHAGDDSTADYPSASNTGSWFFLSGLDVVSPTATGTVVAIGDSITDGYGSSWGANTRWPDDLARRLNAASGGTTRGVADAGIGSNRILTDADSTNPSLLKRFAHDALGQPGVKDVILLEGINDIGNNAGAGGSALTAQQLESGYQTVINQAHARGIRIYGATILPYQGAGYYTATGESIREAVNQWIRTSGAFDAVIDLDAALRSGSNPLALNAAYDCGDHLHPNDKGYQAMANAVDLSLFRP